MRAATLSPITSPDWELIWKLAPDRLTLVPSVIDPSVIAAGMGSTVVTLEYETLWVSMVRLPPPVLVSPPPGRAEGWSGRSCYQAGGWCRWQRSRRRLVGALGRRAE